MAYTVTLGTLVSSTRTRGEFHSPRPSSPDIRQFVNESFAELRDLLIRTDYRRFATTDTVSVVSGTGSYALPSAHLNTISVEVADSTSASGRRQLTMVDWQERNTYQIGEVSTDKRSALWTIQGGYLHLFPTPNWAASLYHIYAAVPTDLATDGSADSTGLDVVSGLGREFLVLGVLMRCAESEGQPADHWEARRARIQQQVEGQLRLQRSEPMAVSSAYVHDDYGRAYRRR